MAIAHDYDYDGDNRIDVILACPPGAKATHRGWRRTNPQR
jgi:hypothetical protein